MRDQSNRTDLVCRIEYLAASLSTLGLTIAVTLLILSVSAPASAIPGAGPGGNLLSFEPGRPASYNPFPDVGFDQRLGEQVPLNLTYTDETGKAVQLKEYFGGKPVILSLAYYDCPMLCTRCSMDSCGRCVRFRSRSEMNSTLLL
jgi:protein SCO1/2